MRLQLIIDYLQVQLYRRQKLLSKTTINKTILFGRTNEILSEIRFYLLLCKRDFRLNIESSLRRDSFDNADIILTTFSDAEMRLSIPSKFM